MMTTFFRADGISQTQIWESKCNAMPSLLYWGNKLTPDVDLVSMSAAAELSIPHGGLDVEEVVSWIPESGRGFTDMPGVELRRSGRRLETQFLVQETSRTGCGWQILLHDAANNVSLQLKLEVHTGCDVFSAGCKLTNLGDTELCVDWLATVTLPVPDHFSQRLTVGGRWTREFTQTREPNHTGAWMQESRVGRTSHHSFPAIAVMTPGTTAAQGEVWSAQLAWSGNHRILLQRCRMGGSQLQMGELLLPGEVTLATAESFEPATVHLSRSDAGLGDLGLGWHGFVRNHILSKRSARSPHLVQFNTWEATYFDHAEDRLFALARTAADVGVERFVLDDGWFAGRYNDRAGLGDWTPCPTRYPRGLAPLAMHCRSLGMQFGLWVEPECVNQDSALYRAHPEWVLGLGGQIQPLGRYQYVLNLGLATVRDHLFAVLSTVLESAEIDFLKWDMNRDMTHAAGPTGRCGVREHVQGLYGLLDRLRAAFPDLLIETCASGGARADLGVLSRSDRVWVSDCNDPLERQRIQSGFLQFLPPELMGVHVGDALSHTTFRSTTIQVRCLNAIFGHFGVEADLCKMSNDDRRFLADAIAFHKAERAWIHDGNVTTVDHVESAFVVLQALSRDGTRGLVSVLARDRPKDAIMSALRLHGLEPKSRYRVNLHPLWLTAHAAEKRSSDFQRGANVCMTGDVLATMGIRLGQLAPGTGVLIELTRLKFFQEGVVS